jgi:hypothetical protein
VAFEPQELQRLVELEKMQKEASVSANDLPKERDPLPPVEPETHSKTWEVGKKETLSIKVRERKERERRREREDRREREREREERREKKRREGEREKERKKRRRKRAREKRERDHS